MAFPEQGMHFQAKGGKSGESPAETDPEQKCRFLCHPGILKGKPHEKAQQEAAEDIDQKCSQVQLVFPGIQMGADQVSQHAAHVPTQKY